MHPFMTELHYLSAEPATYTEIGEMRSLTPFNYTAETGNDSHLKSANAFYTFNRAMKDPGDLPFVLLFSDAKMTLVYSLFNKLPNAPLDRFRIKLPLLSGQLTPYQIDVYGILRELTMSEGAFNSTDPYTIACAIKKSGTPTLTIATVAP